MTKEEIDVIKNMANAKISIPAPYVRDLIEHYEKELAASRDPHVMSWVATSDRVPAIDELNKWNKENKISKDVLCYSEKWGVSFGRYFHLGCFWTINGRSSTGDVNAEYWMEVKLPCT